MPAPGGAELAVWRRGSGRPLIVPPPAPWVTIDRTAPFVAGLTPAEHPLHLPGWQTVRYDERGSGRSSGAFNPTLENRVADLAAVTAAGPQPVALFAQRHAGPVAITYAAANPQHISHLIFWCSYARATDHFDARFRALERLLTADWDLFLRNYAHELLGWSSREADRIVPFVRQAGFEPREFLQSLRELPHVDVSSLLPGLRVPVLVLQRDLMQRPSPEMARRFADAIPGAEYASVPGASFLPVAEHSSRVRERIYQYLEGPHVLPLRNETPGRPLTAREIDVLRLAASGLTNDQIAGRLTISPATVKNHLTSLFLKLGAGNRTSAVARARELGLLH